MQRYLLNNNPVTLWLTGLSGAGKSTIAKALYKELQNLEISSYILDGDELRKGLNSDLGFSAEDRSENIRRAAEVCKILNDAGILVIATFISPFAKDRKMASEIVGKDRFFEIFIDSDLDTCIKRDPKGLYRKALENQLPEFTGISSPYERPASPDILVNTSEKNIIESVEIILQFLRKTFF